MRKFLKCILVGTLLGMWLLASAAEEMPAEVFSLDQIKALDEQVQEVKKEALGITNELIQMEEKLIYPPNTQASIFLALRQGEVFRLGAVIITIDGKEDANHLYTPGELDALQRGGVHRIYTGNIHGGGHVLGVDFLGKSLDNKDYVQHADYKFSKDKGAKLIEVMLAEPGHSQDPIGFKEYRP